MKENIFNSLKQRLRVTGFIEGLSYLILLLIAMPLKYWADMPEAVRYTGSAHGALFVLYILYVFQAYFQKKMNVKELFVSLLASIIPFGTFYADAKIFKKM